MEPKPLTFLHAGGLGDFVYCIPVIRKMGGGVLYWKNIDLSVIDITRPKIDYFKDLKRFIDSQKYITDFRLYSQAYSLPEEMRDPATDPEVPIDVHFHFRFRGEAYLAMDDNVIAYWLRKMDIDPIYDFTAPWLDRIPGGRPFDEPYELVAVTNRARDPEFSWKKFYEERLKGRPNVFFLGVKSEHEEFQQEIGALLPHILVTDFYDSARWIQDCSHFYGVQSGSLSLAQGFGVPYSFQPAPHGARYLVMHRDNEELLLPNL